MSNLAAIRAAAIKSDMEHRGFTQVGGEYHKEGTYGAMGHVRIDYYVRQGSVRIETTGGELPDADSRAETMRATYDSEVFEYWGDEINDIFVKWIVDRPSASPFSGLADALQDAASEISPGPRNTDTQGEAQDYSPGNPRLAGDLTNLETNSAHLQGLYAQEFASSYVAYLGPVIERQSSLAGILAIVAGGERDIWQRTDDDFSQILVRAETAMRESSPEVGSSAEGAVLLLTVVGAVAGVIGAIPTAGGSLAISAAVVAGGASVAGGLISDPPTNPKTELNLAGSTPQAVADKIRTELTEFGDAIDREERVLIDILTDVNAVVTATGTAEYFDLSRPSLNVATDNILKPEQVLVDEYVIGQITQLWLPTIAGDLLQARGGVSTDSGDIWYRPHPIGFTPNGPRTWFLELQETLVGILTNTAQELDDAAHALNAAALEIGLADQAVNAEYRAQADTINTTNDNTPPDPTIPVGP